MHLTEWNKLKEKHEAAVERIAELEKENGHVKSDRMRLAENLGEANIKIGLLEKDKAVYEMVIEGVKALRKVAVNEYHGRELAAFLGALDQVLAELKK